MPKLGDVKSHNMDSCLLSLIEENNVDLLILAEYGGEVDRLCKIVSSLSGTQYIVIPNDGGCNKIKGIINGQYNIQILRERDRYQIAKISTVYFELIIAMIHCDSKRYSRINRQEEVLRRFHNAILEVQEEHLCSNVIAIGDFNVNPFDEACLSSGIMFAVPFAEEVVGKPYRDMGERRYMKFYNPTWKFFGNTSVPYTTYHYYGSGDMANCYWNAVDQVMIRPALVKAFDEKEMRIISRTTGHQLLRNGKPDKINYSDHLPLFCVLKEELIYGKHVDNTIK